MKWLMCLLLVFGLWLLLFWSVDLAVVGTGAFFALIVATFFGDIFPDRLHRLLNPKRWLFLVVYLPYFFFYCVRANLDVALRVIHPDVPIRPGIVKVRTSLTSEMAKTFLANSITLTPGTLTVDVDGQDLYVHWINISTDDAKKRTAQICGRFEPLLRRIFE
ncbi:MAG: Na+/H+ antiporter subunit E [Planctomycetota bacterium]|jgi:multicomponent Na+:H+ antiporter subunit E